MSEIELSQLPDFIVEATEHLEEMETLLLQLADNPNDLEILNEIFRPIHTIKGSAQFIGIARVSRLTHRLEDLLDKLRDGSMQSTPVIVETLIEGRDRIVQLVKELEQNQEEVSSVDDLIDKLTMHLEGGDLPVAETPSVEAETSSLLSSDDQSVAGEFHEENDEELFSIYLNQVREQSSVIQAAIDNIDNAADKERRLLNCLDAVNKLRSSANYMGYDEIAEFCNGWHDSIVEANKAVLKGKDIALSFMDFYFAEFKQFFPQFTQTANKIEVQQSVAESKETVERNAPEMQQQNVSGSVIQEENDEELLAIFLNQLQEKVSDLKAITADLDDAVDKEGQLRNCISILNKLTASANYMGYEEIAEFYVGWAETLGEAAKTISRGKDVSLSFMDFYFAELKQFFPDLDLQKEPVHETVKRSIEKESVQVESPVDDDLESALSASAEIQQDDDLFGRLNNALNESIHQVSKTEYETLNSVFDEMVSPKKGEKQVSEKPAKPAKPERRASGDRRMDERRLFEERRRMREGNERKTRRSLRVDSEKIDTLMNQVGELVVDRSYFVQLLNELGDLQQYLKENLNLEQKELKMIRTFNYRLAEAISGLGRTSNELQEGVMKMRMLPISQIFNRYPRLVHDLTHNTDKKVNLVVNGEETELDKMIVEELSDPLIHIIRNAVDHGIESIEDRKLAGKQPEATLALEAYQESNNIVIEVTDDGRGIDRQKIKNKAIEKGLFTSDELERMSPSEITNIILTAGFSTAEKVTNTSGRGVGMDVVRKNIEKLNGSLEIESKHGAGTRMRVKIPLTLAIIHALMIRTGADIFAIPLANVDETVRINVGDISMIEGVEVIYLRGQSLPVFRLSTLFGIRSDKDTERLYVVIVSSGGQRVGFVVDEMMGQDEVVIKPLVDYVQEKSGFSGATIIGDGRISLILDVYEMVRITAERQSKKHHEQAARLKAKIKPKSKSDEHTINNN